MKKLLAFILCLMLMLGTVAVAEELTELNTDVMEGTTKVALTIDLEDNEFVVVIPATVSIDPSTKKGSFDVILKAGWKLASSNGLQVRVKEFQNGVASSTMNAYFTLRSAEGGTARYRLSHYDGSEFKANLQYSSSSTGYWATHDLISITKNTANTADKVATLDLYVPELPTDPGEYTDTITFAVTLN